MPEFSFTQTLHKIIEHRDLSAFEMTQVMQALVSEQLSDAQLAGFLIAMRMKGETVPELAAAAKVLQEQVTPVKINDPHAVDLVGTGGDHTHTFNISTASSFVVAAAGGVVAKHGNRSVSSRSGSADVLEAAGIALNLTPHDIAHCIKELGIGFMFAPLHHPAIKHVALVRRQLGQRSFFNLLGPLTNPAKIKRQVIGVFAQQWVHPIACVLRDLKIEHALVIHSEDGLDEISLGAPTFFAELKQEDIHTGIITPEQFAIQRCSIDTLTVSNARESLALIRQALCNETGPARDIVALNAGAGIYVAGLTSTLSEGVTRALEVLASGAAYEKFTALQILSQQLAAKGEGKI